MEKWDRIIIIKKTNKVLWKILKYFYHIFLKKKKKENTFVNNLILDKSGIWFTNMNIYI